ncbi:hypothetical protein THAOC_27308, partial [Thalassiosira oceanica]
EVAGVVPDRLLHGPSSASSIPPSCSVPCRLHLPAADPEVGSGDVVPSRVVIIPWTGLGERVLGRPMAGRLPCPWSLDWSVDTKDRTRCDGGSLKEPQGNLRADERKNRTRIGGNLMS